jgi:hypothetical protein
VSVIDGWGLKWAAAFKCRRLLIGLAANLVCSNAVHLACACMCTKHTCVSSLLPCCLPLLLLLHTYYINSGPSRLSPFIWQHGQVWQWHLQAGLADVL